jgi:ligand-binding sensor domain-containing protein
MVSDIFPIFSLRVMQKRMETGILVISLFFSVDGALFPRALADDSSNRQSEFLLESWQVEGGVPRHSVRSLLQTRDGYLWVGTYHGLGRFDGKRFTTFNTANTTNLPSDAVATLFQDREGTLWIGTTGGGLVRYAGGHLQPVKLASDDLSELVEQIDEDNHGTLWVVTSHALFKRQDGSFVNHPLAPGVISPRTYLMAIALAKDGALWLGTSAGLCWARDGAAGAVGYLTNRSVWTLALETTGALWCGGAGEPGLQRIDAGGVYHLRRGQRNIDHRRAILDADEDGAIAFQAALFSRLRLLPP